MSLAYDILYSQKCRSTHHKLAMDALRQLRLPDKQRWEDMFLYYIDWYLEGAKVPDDKFKDFRNHVLHVRENFWGGAIKLAFDWYGKTVDMLRRRDWPAAVYSAGVMSHYFTDPFMPFHTGQTESEGTVHRAVEWSICKSYDSLRRLIEARGYPSFEMSNDPDDWMGEMIRRGAIAGNQHYEICIDHYNLDLGTKNPPAGLDDEMRERIAEQLGLATVGLARVLERAFVDAAATPDSVPVALTMALSTANTPVQAVKDFVNNRAERIRIEEMYAEFKATGKVVNTLPEDDRVVRKAHAAEVLEVPLFLLDAEKTRPPGQKHGTFEPVLPKTTPTGTPVRRRYDINGNPISDDNQPLPVRRYDAPLTGVPLATSASRSQTAGAGKSSPYRSPVYVGARNIQVRGSTENSPPLPLSTTSGADGSFGSGSHAPPETKLKVSTPAVATPAPLPITSPPPKLTANSPNSFGSGNLRPLSPVAEIDETNKTATPPARPSRDPMSDRSGLPKTEESSFVRTGPNRLTSTTSDQDRSRSGTGNSGERDRAEPERARNNNSTTSNRSSSQSGTASPAANNQATTSPVANNTTAPISPLLGALAGGAAGSSTSQASSTTSSGGSSQSGGNGTSTSNSNSGTPDRSAATSSRSERDTSGNDANRTRSEREPRPEREPRDSNNEQESRGNRKIRFYLDVDDDLEKAPSIGNKTAQRFANIGIRTVRDFLAIDPTALASKLNQKGMNVALLRDWQDQARLAAAIPNIRGHDAQIMVGCGLRQAKEVASATVGDLHAFVKEFVATSEGQRVLRGGEMPDAAEITDWINWAKDARAVGG